MTDIRVFYFDYQKLATGMVVLPGLVEAESKELMTLGNIICLVTLGIECRVSDTRCVCGVSSISAVRER